MQYASHIFATPNLDADIETTSQNIKKAEHTLVD